jgi:peptidoglycan hydrolase FlgJ
MQIRPLPPGPQITSPGNPSGPVWQKAVALEAAFLSEMLGHAGQKGASGPFTGGIGEEQFASFLCQEMAGNLASQGGIGLAESIFRSLSGSADAS